MNTTGSSSGRASFRHLKLASPLQNQKTADKTSKDRTEQELELQAQSNHFHFLSPLDLELNGGADLDAYLTRANEYALQLSF